MCHKNGGGVVTEAFMSFLRLHASMTPILNIFPFIIAESIHEQPMGWEYLVLVSCNIVIV